MKVEVDKGKICRGGGSMGSVCSKRCNGLIRRTKIISKPIVAEAVILFK